MSELKGARMSSAASNLVVTDEGAELALDNPEPARPNTPIAKALAKHFAHGGSIDEALRLVERLEPDARARRRSCRQTDRL
jgi:hypothetical protein